MKFLKLEWFYKYTELVFFILLVVYTIYFNNHALYYDEPYYQYNVSLLNKIGLNSEFIRIMNGPAGPLHSVIFWILQPITGNSVLGIRLVNISLLLGVIIFIKGIYSIQYGQMHKFKGWSLGMMSIPMVYVCSGMALTEIPALFMLALSFYLLLKSNVNIFDFKWMLAGVFFSLAILGRQPYLLLSAPFIGWFYYKTINRKKLVMIFLFSICIFFLPVYVFSIWEGLIPLKGGSITENQFINITYLFLGLGYAFLITIILDRSFIISFSKINITYILILFSISFLVCFYLDLRQPLMMTVATKIISTQFYKLYSVFVASVLMTIGSVFLISLIKNIILSINQPIRILFLVCLLIVVSSCAMIPHQFSSRYIFQAAIFFVLIVPPKKLDRVQYILMFFGAVIGILSLYSYKV